MRLSEEGQVPDTRNIKLTVAQAPPQILRKIGQENGKVKVGKSKKIRESLILDNGKDCYVKVKVRK